MRLDDYVTLGRTGLRVSPLCLGTMTFGAQSSWGADDTTCGNLFNRYVDLGGNFIDTADTYTNGHSEELIGRLVASRNLRDQMVIATKFSFNSHPGNPNAGGNGRKNIYRALDASLRRLNTDFIDLYYLHAWDIVTPAEEVVSTLTDLVRKGKIRYYGLSDTPAWYVSRIQTIAEKEGKERIAAIQHEYSLLERTIEREHVPAAQELGIGMCTWAPLAGGMLSGKYRREGQVTRGDGRLVTSNQIWNRFTERNWQLLDGLIAIAAQAGTTPARMALSWVLSRPGVTSVLAGATKPAHLEDAVASMSINVPPQFTEQLDTISALELAHPYKIFGSTMQGMLSGGTTVRGWRRAYPYAGAVARPQP